jgi:hypothetical protein
MGATVVSKRACQTLKMLVVRKLFMLPQGSAITAVGMLTKKAQSRSTRCTGMMGKSELPSTRSGALVAAGVTIVWIRFAKVLAAVAQGLDR